MVFKDGFEFFKSNRKNKKYDVYKNGVYITSFGDSSYQHYHDKIGLWSHLDHNNLKRRQAYQSRHAGDRLHDKTSAGYFAWKYLW